MDIKVAAFSVSKKSIYIGCMRHFQCRLQITYDLREGNRNGFRQHNRLVPHVDKAPLPLRILRLVTSNFLPVENPTHPTAHALERASVYILGQFRTSK